LRGDLRSHLSEKWAGQGSRQEEQMSKSQVGKEYEVTDGVVVAVR
jgi:hypothetical protein